ncbi:MAG: acyl-CoA dehydrogenase family protein [Rickettsiales bacterium]|nr:acyl-CoA dehydrogenase family protein [Rickettsiales bacterium]
MSQEHYSPPIGALLDIWHHFVSSEDVMQLPEYESLNTELVEAILNEAGKFAQERLLPINSLGDKQGCSLDNGVVSMPRAFKDVYHEFCQNGWCGMNFPQASGGQNVPLLVSTAVSEFWSNANMAFGLCPMLTQGAAELVHRYGSDEQKEHYLRPLVTGKWTGTMCLTEPQAGSDLSVITTNAVKQDNHYLIKGNKIYITYGEHDLTDNIIHMVLARTENAPEGSRGLSLFLVPKILPDGTRNDLKAIALEHKMGIHASPTCTLVFGEKDGAVGYLLGELHHGLPHMFTMMNHARLAVGIEGVAIAEKSYQQALYYAKERVQTVPIGGNAGDSIDKHPDVQRMLLTMNAHITVARAICLSVAEAIDLSQHHSDANRKHYAQDIADFLTPIAKAYATDMGFEMSSLALQVFGGAGYIDETGIAQNVKDSRIAMIYEGTNGIQCLDLVMRKLIIKDGRLYHSFKQWLQSKHTCPDHQEMLSELDELMDEVSNHMVQLIKEQTSDAAFKAEYYMKFIAGIIGVYVHSVMIAKKDKSDPGSNWYLTYHLPLIKAYGAQVLAS